jgi:hypothetical protein
MQTAVTKGLYFLKIKQHDSAANYMVPDTTVSRMAAHAFTDLSSLLSEINLQVTEEC